MDEKDEERSYEENIGEQADTAQNTAPDETKTEAQDVPARDGFDRKMIPSLVLSAAIALLGAASYALFESHGSFWFLGIVTLALMSAAIIALFAKFDK